MDSTILLLGHAFRKNSHNFVKCPTPHSNAIGICMGQQRSGGRNHVSLTNGGVISTTQAFKNLTAYIYFPNCNHVRALSTVMSVANHCRPDSIFTIIDIKSEHSTAATSCNNIRSLDHHSGRPRAATKFNL